MSRKGLSVFLCRIIGLSVPPGGLELFRELGTLGKFLVTKDSLSTKQISASSIPLLLLFIEYWSV